MSRILEDAPSQNDAHKVEVLANALKREATRLLAQKLDPGLYVVATPIGNLGDVTVRALSTLALADIVYCEDTRHSARLLQHYGLRPVTRPLHDHNEEAEIKRVIQELGRAKSIALISDAGTPLVSDPGFKLVRACVEAGHAVIALPGPSAVMGALSVSGLPTDAFFFAGFLAPRQAARRARLAELKTIPATLIFFEAPQRVAETLADLADVLGDRPAVMARELTKMHEELARGSLKTLSVQIADRDMKGEIVLVVAPPGERMVDDEEIVTRLEVALASMRMKDAASAVADALGVSKSRVYDLGLKLKGKAE